MDYYIAIDALADLTKDPVLIQMKIFEAKPTPANLEAILNTFCRKNNIDIENKDNYSKTMISLIHNTNTVGITRNAIEKHEWKWWLDNAVYCYMNTVREPENEVHKTDFVRCLIAVKWHRNKLCSI